MQVRNRAVLRRHIMSAMRWATIHGQRNFISFSTTTLASLCYATKIEYELSPYQRHSLIEHSRPIKRSVSNSIRAMEEDITDVLSPSIISALQTEIARCVATCNHNVLWPGFVPSRLLAVGADGSENDNLCLITRGENISQTSWTASATQVKYAALSYCWGGPQDAEKQCKTKLQSLKDRLYAIPFIELTPVVRDAVMVARRLAIPYIWVD
jgi:hypothetical protein